MFGGGDNKYIPRENGTNEIEEVTSIETDKKFDSTKISNYFNNVLKEINDYDKIEEHKNTIIEKLKNEFDINMVFSVGSRSTQTDIKNLSEVDLLVDLGEYSTGYTSDEIIEDLAEKIKEHLPNAQIVTGTMAVAVEFPSGSILQVLPAYRNQDRYMIYDPNRQGWFPTFPKRFTEKVTDLNNQHSLQIVPTIKIVKLICEVSKIEISPYHLSNMVLNAFEIYSGHYNIQKMVSYFFNQAKSLCLQPTLDPSEQTEYIDGDISDEERTELARSFSRVEDKIDDAIQTQTLEKWQELLKK